MPPFRFRRDDTPPAIPLAADPVPAAEPEAVAAPRGTLPCTRSGCASVSGVSCAYTDRKGQSCASAWCPEHGQRIDGGLVMCRRHANVVRALQGSRTVDPEYRPLVDDRSASLVEWVAADLAGTVRLLLEAAAAGHPDVQLISSELTVNWIGVRARVRTWERAWKLTAHTGVVRRVALRVEESSPDVIHVLVDSLTVFLDVPPWITARRLGGAWTGEADQELRRTFHDAVAAAVAEGLAVAAQRETGLTLRTGIP